MLMTGGSGFIGHRTAARLQECGAEVHVISRSPVADDGPLIRHSVDLTRADDVLKVVADVRPDAVFHFASAVTGDRSPDMVSPVLNANLVSATNLMYSCVVHAPSARVILAGSIEEPGRGQGDIPTSPYAAAKWAASGYARMFAHLWDLQVTVLRIAMVYGPGQRDLKKLVPYVVLNLLRGESPRLTSGNRLVDWVYVDDVADAFMRAVDSRDAIGKIFDIGSGKPISIRETVSLISDLTGSSVVPEFGAIPDRQADLPQRADTRAALQLLDWEASTPLSKGLRKTIEWYATETPRE